MSPAHLNTEGRTVVLVLLDPLEGGRIGDRATAGIRRSDRGSVVITCSTRPSIHLTVPRTVRRSAAPAGARTPAWDRVC